MAQVSAAGWSFAVTNDGGSLVPKNPGDDGNVSSRLLLLLSLLRAVLRATHSAPSDGSQQQEDGVEGPAEQSPRPPATVNVKTFRGGCVQIAADLHGTVRKLKCQIQEKNGIPAERQRLMSKGRQLRDDSTLVQYHIEEGATLYLFPVRSEDQIKVKTASGQVHLFNSRDNVREVITAVENSEGGADQDASLMVSVCPANASSSNGEIPAPREFEVHRRGDFLRVTTACGTGIDMPLTESDTIRNVIWMIQVRIHSARFRERLNGVAKEHIPHRPVMRAHACGTRPNPVTRHTIQVNVRTLLGTWIEGIPVSPQDRVASLKTRIIMQYRQARRRLASNSFDLVYRSSVLEDDRMLCEYGIGNDSLLSLVLRVRAQSSGHDVAVTPAKRRKKEAIETVDYPGDVEDQEQVETDTAPSVS